MDLSANVSAGYTDDTSNVYGSDHSFVGAGAANLFGSYYDPNFLSFNIQPFYNQSRLNSSFQSITAASGVTASANIFSGSHFPGVVNYSDTLNSTGNFGVPGLANYTTYGNTDSLGISWGVRAEGLPSLNLSFSRSGGDFSIYGANASGNQHSDTFSAATAYQIAGFNLNGGFLHSSAQSAIPEILADESMQEESNSGVNSFSFGVGHNLPWHGGFAANAARSDLKTDYGDATYTDRYDITIDTITGSLNFAPKRNLDVGASTYYTDNLAGTLYNTLLTAGVILPQNQAQQSSHDLSLTGYASYDLPAQHLHLRTFVERQEQAYWGMGFASDSYNGTASYSNTLLGGQFTGVLGLTRTSFENTTSRTMTGLNGSINYLHQIRQWNVGGGFSYSQATQSVLIAYTSSGFSYNGILGRRLGRRSYWGAYASGAKSLLTEVPGSSNSSRSYSTSLSVPHFSISGSYSMSSGNALLTPTGLVATPIPLPAITPSAVVLYNGRSYSGGIASSPKRGLTLSAVYAKGLSATQSNSALSRNNNENMNFLLIYQFRKIYFNSGYSRLVQGFSFSGAPAMKLGSFYVGISRWFDFF